MLLKAPLKTVKYRASTSLTKSEVLLNYINILQHLVEIRQLVFYFHFESTYSWQPLGCEYGSFKVRFMPIV
jgi:hypothetical protein